MGFCCVTWNFEMYCLRSQSEVLNISRVYSSAALDCCWADWRHGGRLKEMAGDVEWENWWWERRRTGGPCLQPSPPFSTSQTLPAPPGTQHLKYKIVHKTNHMSLLLLPFNRVGCVWTIEYVCKLYGYKIVPSNLSNFVPLNLECIHFMQWSTAQSVAIPTATAIT